jgi:TRAP-type C4-dicarboxylate transport system permease small subunit
VADNTPVPLNRTERVLSGMIASIGGLSLLCVIGFIVASASNADTTGGAWPVVRVLPAIGLPIAFVLIIVFAILSVVRRRRIANGGD